MMMIDFVLADNHIKKIELVNTETNCFIEITKDAVYFNSHRAKLSDNLLTDCGFDPIILEEKEEEYVSTVLSQGITLSDLVKDVDGHITGVVYVTNLDQDYYIDYKVPKEYIKNKLPFVKYYSLVTNTEKEVCYVSILFKILEQSGFYCDSISLPVLIVRVYPRNKIPLDELLLSDIKFYYKVSSDFRGIKVLETSTVKDLEEVLTIFRLSESTAYFDLLSVMKNKPILEALASIYTGDYNEVFNYEDIGFTVNGFSMRLVPTMDEIPSVIEALDEAASVYGLFTEVDVEYLRERYLVLDSLYMAGEERLTEDLSKQLLTREAFYRIVRVLAKLAEVNRV